MAPKRGRSAGAVTSNKKSAKKDTVGPLCNVVCKALDAETGLAESVMKLLKDSVPTSLALLREERHAFQEQVVEMVGQALCAKDAALDKAKEEATSKLAEVAAEKEKLDADVTRAEGEAKTLADAEAAAKAKVEEDSSALKAAKEAADAATKAQADNESEIATSETNKAALEAVQKDHFEPLVEGTAADVKASLKATSKAAKEYLEMEDGVLDNIPPTLGKAKDSRSTFDGLVVNQLQDAIAKALADLAAKLEAGSTAKEVLAAMGATTAEVSTAAVGILDSSEKALAEAKDAAKAGGAKVKDAKASAKTMEPATKKAQKESDTAAAASTTFKEGAFKAFAELRDRAPPPPPPPAPVEEPAAEAAEPAAMPVDSEAPLA